MKTAQSEWTLGFSRPRLGHSLDFPHFTSLALLVPSSSAGSEVRRGRLLHGAVRKDSTMQSAALLLLASSLGLGFSWTPIPSEPRDGERQVQVIPYKLVPPAGSQPLAG